MLLALGWPGIVYQVRGTRYEVRGAGYEVRGTRHEVRGTRYVVWGMGYVVRGTSAWYFELSVRQCLNESICIITILCMFILQPFSFS
jgi:hypothetical protein